MIARHLPPDPRRQDRQGCGLGDTFAFVAQLALWVVALLLAFGIVAMVG